MNFYFTNSPSKAEISFLYENLREFNTDYFKILQESEFCIFVKSECGKYIAGAYGKRIFTIININFLWVSESHRSQGLGKALIQQIEIEAKSNGIENICVETYTFQAVGFYSKLGFQEVGRYTDYPKRGIDKVMLKKNVGN